MDDSLCKCLTGADSNFFRDSIAIHWRRKTARALGHGCSQYRLRHSKLGSLATLLLWGFYVGETGKAFGMTKTSLSYYLRICGWATIIATVVQFVLTIIQRTQRMSELGVDGELRTQANAMYTIGFGIELPIILTIACLCLAAARVLKYKQKTLQSVFE